MGIQTSWGLIMPSLYTSTWIDDYPSVCCCLFATTTCSTPLWGWQRLSESPQETSRKKSVNKSTKSKEPVFTDVDDSFFSLICHDLDGLGTLIWVQLLHSAGKPIDFQHHAIAILPKNIAVSKALWPLHSQHGILDSASSSVSRVVQVTGAESRCLGVQKNPRKVIQWIWSVSQTLQFSARMAYTFSKTLQESLFFTTSTPFCWNVKFPWPRHPLAWCPEILAPSHVEVRVGHKEKKGDVGPMVGCSAASSLHHRSSCAHLNCECVYIYIIPVAIPWVGLGCPIL